MQQGAQIVPSTPLGHAAMNTTHTPQFHFTPQPIGARELAQSFSLGTPVPKAAVPQAQSRPFNMGGAGRTTFEANAVDEAPGVRLGGVFGGPVFRRPPSDTPLTNNADAFNNNEQVAHPPQPFATGGSVFTPAPRPTNNTFHLIPQAQTVKLVNRAIAAPAKEVPKVAQASSRPPFNILSLSLVDKHFSAAPSVAGRHPKYVIQFIDRQGHGGMSRTFRGQLRSSNPLGAAGPLVFAKLVLKDRMKGDHHTEVRAYDLYVYDLLDTARRGEKFKAKENLRLWIAQAAAGIHYLHCIGIIHRDIKPNNFLIDWSLNARVSDLGLAWISSEAKPLHSSENYAHLNVGTSVYKAPEVHALADKPNRNHKFSDPCEHNLKYAAYGLKVDWWGYGMTVYELTRLIYESPKWDLSRQDLIDLMKAWKQAQIVKMPWAFREEANAQEGATQGESDDPWSKALTERNVPQELHGLLEKVLAIEPKERADFNDVCDDDYFVQGLQRSIFYDLPGISSSRKEKGKPQSVYTMDEHCRDLTLTVDLHTKSSGPDILSWISPETTLFNGLE